MTTHHEYEKFVSFSQIGHTGFIFLQNTTETLGNVVCFVTEEGKHSNVKNLSTIRKNRQELSYNLPVIVNLLTQDWNVIVNQEVTLYMYTRYFIMLWDCNNELSYQTSPCSLVELTTTRHPPSAPPQYSPYYPCVVNLHWSPTRETNFPSCMRPGKGDSEGYQEDYSGHNKHYTERETEQLPSTIQWNDVCFLRNTSMFTCY